MQRLLSLMTFMAIYYVKSVVSQDAHCNITSHDNGTYCGKNLCINGYCELSSETCVCVCFPECQGDECDICCELSCQHGGYCEFGQSGKQYCVCSYTGYTGELCEVPEVNNCRSPANRSWTRCNTVWCKNGHCEKHPLFADLTYDTCHCYAGWGGRQCDICCDLPCLHNGYCKVENVDVARCHCDGTGYHGEFCQIPYPPRKVRTTTTLSTSSSSTPSSTTAVVTSLPVASTALQIIAALLILLLAAVAVVVIVIVRKRRSAFSKHISRFTKWEKDESKTYDVMILFSCHHEPSCQLVTRELLPAIEDLELIVCSNQPSILPQYATEESISKASQESKRIILLLSQQFIDDNDTSSAGATEDTDMLEVLDVDRTVAILMESLDEQRCYFFGLPVSYIRESVVCLNYPQQQTGGKATKDFWKKLKLCLPRKRTEFSIRFISP